ncbi:MAG TPA: hypothetical protein VIE67_01780 [Rudaea sp.]|uniref:hypothetical protein n=1 Tax=Rudaea sp. TaxID=2136325 RepID=UPI002F91EE9C
MLKTYSEYIDSYLSTSGLNERPCPGEHHFVSAYLVPRLFKLNQRIPDYINPDGTKGVIGDIVYYKDHKHQFGIEAKLGTIRLTKGEFNDWVVREDSSRWPRTFIGISTTGVGLCPWAEFREAYVASIKEKSKKWTLDLIAEGYGPTKSIDLLFDKLPTGRVFRKGTTLEQSERLEASFIKALKSEVDC